MPRTQTEKVTALAHCPDPRCEGHTQREVDATKNTVEHTYVELGGDMPGVERSQVYFDAKGLKCECGRPLQITDQRRVSYAPLSGKDPNGLLQYKPPELSGV